MTNESEDEDKDCNEEEEFFHPDPGWEPEPIPFNAPIHGHW